MARRDLGVRHRQRTAAEIRIAGSRRMTCMLSYRTTLLLALLAVLPLALTACGKGGGGY